MSFTPSRPPGGETADTGPEGSGAPGIENAAVERRKARPVDRKTGAAPRKSRHTEYAPSGAPLPLLGVKTGSALLWGAKTRSAFVGERHRQKRPENSGGKPPARPDEAALFDI